MIAMDYDQENGQEVLKGIRHSMKKGKQAN
jgi:hypothetical protein